MTKDWINLWWHTFRNAACFIMIIPNILSKVVRDGWGLFDCDMRTTINLLTKEYTLAYLQAYALLKSNGQLKSKCRTKFSHFCVILWEPTNYSWNSEFPENDLWYFSVKYVIECGTCVSLFLVKQRIELVKPNRSNTTLSRFGSVVCVLGDL